MPAQVPSPSTDYQAKQLRFKELLSGTSNEPPQRIRERTALKKYLVAEFEKAFQLERDTGKAADRFYHRNHGIFVCDAFTFEHRSFYRRGYNIVIVAQPYDFKEDEFKKWARQVGAMGTAASAWGFWNPGVAGLLIAEFTPEAKVAIDKAREGISTNLRSA